MAAIYIIWTVAAILWFVTLWTFKRAINYQQTWLYKRYVEIMAILSAAIILPIVVGMWVM